MPEHQNAAELLFQGTDVMITIRRQRHLGAPLGVKTFIEEFVEEKVRGWVREAERLSTIVRFQPQAHTVFTYGLMHRWTFLMQSTPGVEDLFQSLEVQSGISSCPLLQNDRPSVIQRESWDAWEVWGSQFQQLLSFNSKTRVHRSQRLWWT